MQKISLIIFCVFISQWAFSAIQTPLDYKDEAQVAPGTLVYERIDGFPVILSERGEYEVVIEVNDAGEYVGVPYDEYLASKGSNFLNLITNYFDFKKTFQTVSSYVTEEMEARFDLFIVVNVDYRKNIPLTEQQIPSQHMRILRKTSPGQKVFMRDSSGEIIGFHQNVLGMGTQNQAARPAYDCLVEQQARFTGSSRGMMESNGLFKVSSGRGRNFKNTPWNDDEAYLDTPTGVYRFNDARNTRPERGRSWNDNRTATFRSMYFPLYFDLHYPIGRSEKSPRGRESALAMHGTSTGSYSRLGSQASHGCVRTHQQVNWCVKSQFHKMDDSFTSLAQIKGRNSVHGGPLIEARLSNKTPFLDSRFRLKSEERRAGRVVTQRGTPALFIIFYGYDESLESGEIVEL